MKRKLLSIVQIINIISILIFFNTVIHDDLISYILTRALLIYQFIWIILGLYLLYQRKIRGPDYVLLFLFPLLLLQYVVKGYSSGLASLPSDIRVLPRMRATVAYEILHDSGRLDPLLEPHLAYPQEFIVVYILKLVTSRLIVELYEGVMKPLSLIFWTILMMLLYESVFKDIRYAIAELSLVGLLTALLLTFLPGYSSEVGYASQRIFYYR